MDSIAFYLYNLIYPFFKDKAILELLEFPHTFQKGIDLAKRGQYNASNGAAEEKQVIVNF